jgi:hypothetical protein
MDKDLEDELLMHVAAGTDLPTAWAALPRDLPPDHEPSKPSTWGWALWAMLMALLFVVWLFFG